MRVGKLTPKELQEHVFSYLVQRRPEVKLRSALGEDSTILDLGYHFCVKSTDPITGEVDKAGWLAVHVSANEVASNGAEPVCCLMTILMPAGTSMEFIAQVMKDAAQAAKELDIEISCGHTELTAAVNKPVISTTVVGKASKDMLISSDGAKPGDQIVVTKNIGLEGTAILATDAKEYLSTFLSQQDIEEATNMLAAISVVKEGILSTEFGVNAMHDITEGGLLGALYEMAEGAELGFSIEEEKVPLAAVTNKICQHLGLDVLRFLSSGSMLIATDRGEQLLEHLGKAGIESSIIGEFTQSRDKFLTRQNKKIKIDPPEGDELWRGLEIIDKK